MISEIKTTLLNFMSEETPIPMLNGFELMQNRFEFVAILKYLRLRIEQRVFLRAEFLDYFFLNFLIKNTWRICLKHFLLK